MSVIHILAEIRRDAEGAEHRNHAGGLSLPGEYDLMVHLVSGVNLVGKLKEGGGTWICLDVPLAETPAIVHRHYICHEGIVGIVPLWL